MVMGWDLIMVFSAEGAVDSSQFVLLINLVVAPVPLKHLVF